MILKRTLKITKWFFSILLSLCILFTASIYIFEDQIVESILDEVNSNLTSPIQADEVEVTFWSSFPNLNVNLKKVSIRGAKKDNEPDLLHSENINLAFSPFDFFDGKYNLKTIEIAPGELNLLVDTAGNVNYDIVKESDSDEEFMVQLKKIVFRKFTVNYLNALTKQSFSTQLKDVALSGDLSNEQFDLKSSGDFHLNSFSSNGVQLIENKEINCSIDLSVDQVNNAFILHPSIISVESLPFHCRGKIQKDSLDFRINSKDILISEMVKALVPKEKMDLSHLKGEGNIDFDLRVFGERKIESPALIACRFDIENGSIVEPYKGTAINNIHLNGEYTNIGGESEEKIELNNFSCKTISGPFQGSFTFKNFQKPRLFGKVNGKMDLQVIQNIFRLKGIKQLKGMLSLDSKFDFSQNMKTEDFDIKSFESNLDVVNAYLSLKEDARVIEHLNGNLNFNGKDLRLKNVSFKVGESDLLLNGTLMAFYKNLKGSEELQTNLKLKSNYLNLDKLLSSGVEETEEEEAFTLPDFIQGQVNMDVREFVYDQKSYSNVLGKVQFDEHHIELTESQFVHANSLWTGNLLLSEKVAGTLHIGGKLNTPDADLKTLFKHWDNLGQDALVSENIVSGNANVSLKFDFPYVMSKEDFDYDNIEASIALNIPKATFKNVALFKEMTESLKENASKLVLGLNNIRELDKKLQQLSIFDFKNTITITHGNIIIPKMTIRSSAMDIELTAVHGFNDIVDYRLVIPFRSLKITEKESDFGIIEKEGDGLSLYLKVFGNLEDLKFEWDKQRHKQQVSENIVKEKNQIKSMLKTEFGLFSKDAEVKKFEQPKKQKEAVINLNFNPKKEEALPQSPAPSKTSDQEDTKKRKGLLRNTIQSWKENSTNNESKEPVIKIN